MQDDLTRRIFRPGLLRPTHILHRDYHNRDMRIIIEVYEDNTYFVTAPIDLSDEDIALIDWSKNTFGYALTYPNGITTGQAHGTFIDHKEVNPFNHLLDNITGCVLVYTEKRKNFAFDDDKPRIFYENRTDDNKSEYIIALMITGVGTFLCLKLALDFQEYGFTWIGLVFTLLGFLCMGKIVFAWYNDLSL
jgi:hypothetical protein